MLISRCDIKYIYYLFIFFYDIFSKQNDKNKSNKTHTVETFQPSRFIGGHCGNVSNHNTYVSFDQSDRHFWHWKTLLIGPWGENGR